MPTPSSAPRPGAAGAPAPQTRPAARLEQLFRYSLRQGEINPLLYILLRYRQGSPQ